MVRLDPLGFPGHRQGLVVSPLHEENLRMPTEDQRIERVEHGGLFAVAQGLFAVPRNRQEMRVKLLRSRDVGIELEGPPPGFSGAVPIPVDIGPDRSQDVVGLGGIRIELEGPQGRGLGLRSRLPGRDARPSWLRTTQTDARPT